MPARTAKRQRSPAQLANDKRLGAARREAAELKHRPPLSADTSAVLSDEELGIGFEEEEAPADPLEAILSDPRMAKLLDAAVVARMAQLGAPQQSGGSLDNNAMVAFTETIRHLIDTNAEQRPGYIKPLPAEEVDRRAAGRVEMFALLKKYEQMGLAPAWIVGDGGFFECTNAQEFKPGAKIRTYLPPPEDFIPDNEPAAAVHAAQLQWLGGRTPHISETVAEFEQARAAANKQGPLVTGAMQPSRTTGSVELVEDAPLKPAPSRKRMMGTIAPERRDVSMADRAAGGLAQGPTFVGADAA